MAASVRTAVTSAYTSGVPNGYLKMTNPGATQDQADTLKAAWMAAHGNARSIAVLNATTEFQPISWSLSDLSAIEMGAFTDKDIAHAFGMSRALPGRGRRLLDVRERAGPGDRLPHVHPAAVGPAGGVRAGDVAAGRDHVEDQA